MSQNEHLQSIGSTEIHVPIDTLEMFLLIGLHTAWEGAFVAESTSLTKLKKENQNLVLERKELSRIDAKVSNNRLQQ